jgi:hypothetical protein
MKATSTASTATTTDRELRLDRLLGRQVLTKNNQGVGRIEEFRAEKQGRDWVVVEYVIGAAGLFERLGVGVKLLFGRHGGGGHVVRWDQLDISDPERPRLTCGVQDLRKL